MGHQYEGFPDFGYLDKFKAAISVLNQGAIVFEGYDRYRQHYSSFLYQQIGMDPFPYPVATSSGSFSVASQDIVLRARHILDCLNVIADCVSRKNEPLTTECIVIQIFGTWGAPAVDMFATVHNTHLLQFMSLILEPPALAVDALSQDWQGGGGDDVRFHRSPCSTKSFRNYGPPRTSR